MSKQRSQCKISVKNNLASIFPFLNNHVNFYRHSIKSMADALRSRRKSNTLSSYNDKHIIFEFLWERAFFHRNLLMVKNLPSPHQQTPPHINVHVFACLQVRVCCVCADCYVWLFALAILKKRERKTENEKRKTENTVNNFTFNRNRFLLPFLFFSMKLYRLCFRCCCRCYSCSCSCYCLPSWLAHASK